MNKLIIVTGGSKGIGKAIIEKFAANNFDIITVSRNAADLEKLKQSIVYQYPHTSFAYLALDLSRKVDVLKFADFVKSHERKIDVLVNNTGIYVPGQIHNEAEGQLELMINTNLFSAYHLTRALIEPMISAKEGHIFNICSTASIMPYVNGGSYCVSKYALYGMTKVLREEMKEHRIKVTAILPGATKTSSWDGVDLPDERFIPSKDIGEIIYNSFILSKSSVIEEILIRPQEGDII